MSQVNVDRIKSRAGTGSPTFTNGLICSGVGTFSSHVSIAGTLTYEDVTNVDSVGIVTARAGVRVTAGGINVTAGITTLPADGILVGTGSSIFQPASNTLTLGTNSVERIRLTSSGTVGIGTESAGGPRLGIAVDNSSTNVLATGGAGLVLKNTNTTDNTWVSTDYFNSVGGIVGRIGAQFKDTSDKDTDLYFCTRADGGSLAERLRITSTGVIDVNGGDVELSGTAAGVSSCTWDASQNYLNLKDNSMIVWGDSQDLKIYHDGSHAYIANTTGNLILQGKYGESSIKCEPNDKVTLWYDNALRLSTTTTGVSIADTCSDAIGDLRSVPLQDESGSGGTYILAVSDKGQCVHAHGTTTGVTVNINTFAAGDAVSIVNGSSGNIAITQGTSFTLRNTSDSSSGSLTLASFGMATIWFSGHNVGYISGSGLS